MIAVILNNVLGPHESLVFYLEAVGIFAFAAYSLTKSKELSLSSMDKKALAGQPISLNLDQHTGLTFDKKMPTA